MHYKAQDYDEALAGYNKALAAAPRGAQETAVYHANSAACHLALSQYQECVRSCNAAIEVDSTYQKAILRRMAAFEALDQLDSALKDAQQVRQFLHSLYLCRSLVRGPQQAGLEPIPYTSNVGHRRRRHRCSFNQAAAL